MTKSKPLGVINESSIKYAFSIFGYKIEKCIETNNLFKVQVSKDFSKSFNITFDGLVRLEAIIYKKMYESFCVFTYPKFVELTEIIPKKGYCHIYPDGSFCYAPPQRPLEEKWNLKDFVNSIDALINDYFSIEYIGYGELKELEHGDVGLLQYNIMKNNNTN